MSEHDVARSADVAEGALLSVDVAGRALCLFRFAGAVGAVEDRCSHADFALSDGALRADGTLECVWHGARFDCRTGAAVHGPATDPVPTYVVSERDGRIVVALPDPQ